MSNISVNTITDASGGSTASINGLTPQASNMQPFNRIINGAMTIDQRNAGAAVTPAVSTYTLDRWRVGVDTDQRMSFQQVSDAPEGFTKSILCTVTTGGSTSASNLLYLQQNIEGFNVSDLGFGTASAKTVTASFWVKSSVVGLKSVSLINGSLSRAYCTTYNIETANTWEYKTVTILGDTSGTWETGNGKALELHFNFQVGSTYETTLDTWAAGRFYSASSVPDLTTTAGATINFTGVQLEAGSTASSFAHENYEDTLRKCQRYFYSWSSSGLSDNYHLYSPYVSSPPNSSASIGYFFPVTMRANPSMVGTGLSLNRFTSNLNGAVAQLASTSSASAYSLSGFTASAEL